LQHVGKRDRYATDDPGSQIKAEVSALTRGLPLDLGCVPVSGCAELVGTRKVTDQGWLPRNRQVGLTGHSLSPRLYLTLGVSGKFNHLVGVHRAGTVLAVNTDPQAAIYGIGVPGDLAAFADTPPTR
jgi:hypothetical protein